MSTQTRSGFTIIEVMLFLAISGALAVAVLVGSGAAIGRQRYQDSVNSFKGLIQEQYSQIANVVNSEASNPVCTPSGETLTMNDARQQARGTAECLVMGRFLLVQPTTVTTYNLIGQPPVSSKETSDSGALRQYAIAVQTPEAHEVSWGARIVAPEATTDVTTGVLVVRSPLSGSILTYTQDLPPTTQADDYKRLSVLIHDMITDTNMAQKDFCVDSDGALSALSRRRAVRIKARAANQSAVEIPLESENVCD